MNRFWKRNYIHHEGNPNMVITTREIGDIPGCIEAVDIFIEMSTDQISIELAKDPYNQVWDDYRNGVIGWNEWLNHPVHKRRPRSFIKNPSLPIERLIARIK